MKVLAKAPKQRTEVRQAGLVEAALMLAAQRSPADITTADLAQAVGITQGAVFRHFASKEAIWLAVLDWVAEALMTRLQAAATPCPKQRPEKSMARTHPLRQAQWRPCAQSFWPMWTLSWPTPACRG